jgi:hypothetical protein
MNKIAIQRGDGVARIGVLCDVHTTDAIDITEENHKRIWVRFYDGTQHCEACGENDYLHTEEGNQ